MGAGAYLEPLAVVVLLFGGAWINRASDVSFDFRMLHWQNYRPLADKSAALADEKKVRGAQEHGSTSSTSSLPSPVTAQDKAWRMRELRVLGFRRNVSSPNTGSFRNRLLSRLLLKFPFLVECWYWALIYWVYQLGRAFTAVTLQQGTVHVARQHALKLIEIEKRWHIFWEIPIQQFFLQYPPCMKWINWLYSFIHIPGTIAFLGWLYYQTITRKRPFPNRSGHISGNVAGSRLGPALYEARRRTMAVCNLLAFVVFTVWPCMPPRLLSDTSIEGPTGAIARSYGFVDTVHGKSGASSVWTQNKFCNQYAAMPSLHFGYSLLIGLTIMTFPLSPTQRRGRSLTLPIFNQSHPDLAPRIHLPSGQRILCLAGGFFYPSAILVAIISTANHFILDALAGACVCVVGWWGNAVLLNLLPLEDYFLWTLGMHKPVLGAVEATESLVGADADQEDRMKNGLLAE